MFTFDTEDFRFLFHVLVVDWSCCSDSETAVVSNAGSLPSLDFLELVPSTPEIAKGTLCFALGILFLFLDWLVDVASGTLNLSSKSRFVPSSFNWTDDPISNK